MNGLHALKKKGKDRELITIQSATSGPLNGKEKSMLDHFKDKVKRYWKEWGWQIIVLIAVMITFRSSVADWNDVPTGSMKPTILEGDRIFVNKIAYDLRVPLTSWRIAQWSDPGRGDIVVFSSPADGKRLVKRVIGLPGDEIELRNNTLYVNGEPAEYGSLSRDRIHQLSREEQSKNLLQEEQILGEHYPIMLTPFAPGRKSCGPLTVPDGQYFIMGDNRDNSADSRYFGCVDRKAILGQATAVVLSLNRDRYYLPRFERFFRGLP